MNCGLIQTPRAGTAPVVADDVIVAAAVAAIPPTAFYPFRTGQQLVTADIAGPGFLQQPAGAVAQCIIVGQALGNTLHALIQRARTPAVFRAVVLNPGHAADGGFAESCLQALSQAIHILFLFRRTVAEQAALAGGKGQQLRRIQLDIAHGLRQAQAFQPFTHQSQQALGILRG